MDSTNNNRCNTDLFGLLAPAVTHLEKEDTAFARSSSGNCQGQLEGEATAHSSYAKMAKEAGEAAKEAWDQLRTALEDTQTSPDSFFKLSRQETPNSVCERTPTRSEGKFARHL